MEYGFNKRSIKQIYPLNADENNSDIFIDFGPNIPDDYSKNYVFGKGISPNSIFVAWTFVKSGQYTKLTIVDLNTNIKKDYEVDYIKGGYYFYNLLSNSRYKVILSLYNDGVCIDILNAGEIETPPSSECINSDEELPEFIKEKFNKLLINNNYYLSFHKGE